MGGYFIQEEAGRLSIFLYGLSRIYRCECCRCRRGGASSASLWGNFVFGCMDIMVTVDWREVGR